MHIFVFVGTSVFKCVFFICTLDESVTDPQFETKVAILMVTEAPFTLPFQAHIFHIAICVKATEAELGYSLILILRRGTNRGSCKEKKNAVIVSPS